jgi:hypothetical protein
MYQSLFDSNTRKTKRAYNEMWLDVIFPMKYSASDYLGKILIGFGPTNNNHRKENLNFNPPKFILKSFESKRPL